MIATGIFVYCAVVAAMTVATSYFGNRITSTKIPMQWEANGQPTWYAAKSIALWTPICLTVVGGPLFLLVGDPRMSEHAALGLLVFSVIMAAIYSVYLAAVLRWASRQRS